MDSTAVMDNPSTNFKSTWNRWQALAVFEANVDNINTTSVDHLSKLIILARQVRQSSLCTMVVVASFDREFLVAFAQWSLKLRLLVWTTKLVVVTHLPFTQLQALLPAYWTFSMMNAVFLNKEEYMNHTKYGVYTYLPYSPAGSQTVKIAFWTSVNNFTPLTSVSFFQDKFENFHGAAVNVTAQPYMPYWGEEQTKEPDGSRMTIYRGSDYRLLEAVASVLNFKIRVIPTLSWDDVTSLVENRTSLIASVIYGMLTVRAERYDFSFSYAYGHRSFAMAKPNLEARWTSLYYPLAREVWMSLLVPLFLVPSLLILFTRADHDGQKRYTGIEAVLQNMMGMLLGQNLPQRLSSTSSIRILVASWLIFAFILAVAYRSNLTASLTLPKYPPRPETLQEVVDTVDIVTVPPYGEQYRKFYSESNSLLFQALGRIMQPGPSLLEGLKNALVKRSSHAEEKKYLQYEIMDKFTEEDGSTRLYVSRESLFSAPSAWPIPHDAPYKAHLDRQLLAVLGAGLYDKWTADILTQTKLSSQRRQRQRQAADQQERAVETKDMSKEGTPILTLSHTQGGFILLMAGLGLATFAFSCEMLPCT
ncbi:uncharacterized protein LOC123505234 [Portunus trituberculatus]|uniref:uncharacterized protein LOC123505234 n=1 Tax=Portunus trituberculatus TaxID=210409 RepID=UPI001E1CC5A8|nr:uncharacterized protein LOC123505234 [Portunus trituberculatus]